MEESEGVSKVLWEILFNEGTKEGEQRILNKGLVQVVGDTIGHWSGLQQEDVARAIPLPGAND